MVSMCDGLFALYALDVYFIVGSLVKLFLIFIVKQVLRDLLAYVKEINDMFTLVLKYILRRAGKARLILRWSERCIVYPGVLLVAKNYVN